MRALGGTGRCPSLVGLATLVVSVGLLWTGGSALAQSPSGAPAPSRVLSSPAGSAASGAGRNHFHVEISRGPQAGTWDVSTDEPCLAGADTAADWIASYVDPAGVPSSVTVALYPDQPEQTGLNIEFARPEGALSLANPIDGPAAVVSIDDRGEGATLSVSAPVQAYDTQGNTSDAGQASITVDCGNILRNPLGPSPSP
jgi:hypothetical protein